MRPVNIVRLMALAARGVSQLPLNSRYSIPGLSRYFIAPHRTLSSGNDDDPSTSGKWGSHILPAPLDVMVPLRVRSNIKPHSGKGDTLSISGAEHVYCDADGWDVDVVKSANIKYVDSSQLRLRRRAMVQWEAGLPKKVLIVKKPGNAQASQRLRDIGVWLESKGLEVMVERAVHATEFPQYTSYDQTRHDADFCITLGGDGTVLHLASMFEEDMPLPPVISFAMGTLGFLTPFDVNDFEHCLERVLASSQKGGAPLHCTLRTRKRCELRHAGQLVCVHNVLNEVVIDRGAFPGAVLLELFVDGHYVTNIEADGLIVSTPSGSTAYSMSAGGPMVAPSVPCSILSPIAPLSLSFRPLVIPESSDIVIHLPEYARSYARASFDGKKPMRMRKDCTLHVTTSLCPLPMINMATMDQDWYEGITQKLKWNQTIRQPPTMPRLEGDENGNLRRVAPPARSNGKVAAAGPRVPQGHEDDYVQYP